MNKNIRKALLICSCAPLLMSVLCEREVVTESLLVYNMTKITISEGASFSVSDTLWISGEVSSMIFERELQDSIQNTDEAISDIINIHRLQPQNSTTNTTEAVNEFDFVVRVGSIFIRDLCPEAQLSTTAPLTENGQNYKYEIGIVTKNPGDFALSWQIPVAIKNSNLNYQILENYPIDGDVTRLGLTQCETSSTVADVRERRSEFFFSVE